MATFSELLTNYISRAGITDSELARSIGVRRQTIFRWKEGTVARPRHRDDVLRCAERLRLSADERDRLLMAAGFAPEVDRSLPSSPDVGQSRHEALPNAQAPDAEDAHVQDPESEQDVSPDTPVPDGSMPNDVVSDAIVEDGAGSRNAERTPEATVRQPGRWAAAIGGMLTLVLIALIAVATFSDLLPGLAPGVTATSQDSTPRPATATPIVSAEGETLVLVSEFANYSPDQGFNVAGRLQEAIVAEITAAKLISTTAQVWPHVLSSQAEAQRVLVGSRAAMLIWGEYDSGRVRVHLSTANESTGWEKLLPSPAELSTTINLETPHEVRSLAVLTLGKLYRENGDTLNARGAFRRVLELQPGEEDTVATATFYLATVLAAEPNTDYLHAVRLYDEVVALHPDWVNVRYNRGTAYLKHYYRVEGTVADLDAAILDLTWVVEKRSSYADAHLNRGIAFYERDRDGDMDQAVTDLERAVELSSEGTRAAFNRGLARIRRGDANWADDFEQILADDPESADAHNALCWGYALGQEPERALLHCNSAIELGLTDTVYDGRGIALAQLGRSEEAVADLTLYLETLRLQPVAAYVRMRGPLVEEWIAELEAGRTPFDEETLAALR